MRSGQARESGNPIGVHAGLSFGGRGVAHVTWHERIAIHRVTKRISGRYEEGIGTGPPARVCAVQEGREQVGGLLICPGS